VPTWILSQSEIEEKFYSHGVSMPFQCNNVDASVGANMVFGLTSGLLYDTSFQEYFDDEHIQRMYLDTTDMLAWILETNVMNERPDLTLLYYPPVYDYYWFVSRTLHLLNSAPENSLPVPELLIPIRDKLNVAMRRYGTEQLLTMMKREGYYVYWDDFLGNGDLNSDGVPSPKFEDRVFSTTVALNALIDAWTISKTVGSSRYLSWDESAPSSIRSVIFSGIQWILDKSQSFSKENVFFSGSVKSEKSLPFYFPQNIFREIDSSKEMGCDAVIGMTNGSTIIVGVQNLVDSQTYTAQLAGNCHGSSVPISNSGLNCDHCFFPYWSSPALTSALEVLVLSKAKSLSSFIA
jgi:hypothetical protein